MSVHISKKAELFYKALEDVWSAEQLWAGSPNNAVWLCTQAAEKTMKGFLNCLNKDYNYSHNLKELLDVIRPLIEMQPETLKNIMYLNNFGVKLRYKNMPTDPTKEDSKVAISRTKQIIQEFSNNTNTSSFIKEAGEVHSKILKASTADDIASQK